MSSMDPAGGAPAYDYEQAEQAPDGGGYCSSCGRPLPEADLEAIAAGIDHTLSLESGRMVARTAWAGRPPDGLVDALFSFTSGAKARRRLWERGQQLWAEQMTVALAGPCADCLQRAGYGQPETIARPDALAYEAAPAAAGAAPLDSGTAVMPPAPAAAAYDAGTAVLQPSGLGAGPDTPAMPAAAPVAPRPQSVADDYEGQTRAVPRYGSDAVGASAEDAATRARPATPREVPPPAPTPPVAASGPAAPVPTATPGSSPAAPADDYEAHTMMFSAPPSLRPVARPARLVVADGPVHGRHFTLNRAMTTIGRSIGCHVTVDDDAIGYDHARIVRDDDGWRIEAVAAAGDLFVNDVAVAGAQALANGDVIRVGSARLRFEAAG